MTKKSEAIEKLFSVLCRTLDYPSTERRMALEDAISATVAKLNGEDLDYLRGRLDSLADDLHRRDGLSPRQRLAERTRDMWKR
jgi:hypothetical protein